MSTHFVYLHIPKSAGTSQRVLLYRNYGESNVYWYGINAERPTFDAQEVEPFRVLGGHRPRNFFHGDRIDCFFSAVVREPVSRAISLFNYFATHPLTPTAVWVKKGLQPDSMLRTIENCPAFTTIIQNMQCRYLSGRRTFDAARAALNEFPCAVGLFDDLPIYNEKLASLFGWRTTTMPRVWCGPPRYEQAIREQPGLVHAVERLNREDIKLYEWLSSRGGLVNDRDLAKYRGRLRVPPREPPVDFAPEDVQNVRLSVIDSAPAGTPGTPTTIRVRIENHSSRVLPCSGPHPVVVSYRIHDIRGELPRCDGVRTRLQRDIPPGEVANVAARVEIPPQVSGEICRLNVGLMQERVASFESIWPEHLLPVECFVRRGNAA